MFKTYSDIFSQRADSYHRAMMACPHARENEFMSVLKQYSPREGEIVCDIPAGGGYFWNYLKHTGCHYTAIETSKYFYEHCPTANSQQRKLCKMHQIEMPDNQVDALYSIAGLHHLENRQRVYQEFFRLLRNNGIAVIADVPAGSIVGRFLNEFVDQQNSMGHEGIFIDQSDIKAMTDCGFKIRSNKVIDFDWTFPSVNEMTDYCRLLFGLDKASDQDIHDGIREFVGYTVNGDLVFMHWHLQFITLQKTGQPSNQIFT